MGKKTQVEEHIKRPMNAFMAWSKKERRKMVEEGTNLNNSVMSKILGDRWRGLEEEERRAWKRTAERLKKEHAEMFPNYKYKPKRRTSSGNSSTSSAATVSPVMSLYGEGGGPPEVGEGGQGGEGGDVVEGGEDRPDTPDSLGSLEGLDMVDMEEVEESKGMQELIEAVMARELERENIPPASLDRIMLSSPKVSLPQLTQAMLAPKRKQDAVDPPQRQVLGVQARIANSVGVGGQKVEQLRTTTYNKALFISQNQVPTSTVGLSRPLILKKEPRKVQQTSKKDVSFHDMKARLQAEAKDSTGQGLDADNPNPTVDNPRTFPALVEQEKSYIGDMERTFRALGAVEDRRGKGEVAVGEEKRLEFMRRLDTWGGERLEEAGYSPFSPALDDQWELPELDLPSGWRDEELFTSLDTGHRSEQVFVSCWLPKCALKMRRDPYRALLRTINNRDPAFNQVW